MFIRERLCSALRIQFSVSITVSDTAVIICLSFCGFNRLIEGSSEQKFHKFYIIAFQHTFRLNFPHAEILTHVTITVGVHEGLNGVMTFTANS